MEIDLQVRMTAADAYDHVLHIANRVLRSCKLFSLEMLQEENPTIAEIAKGMRLICNMIEQIGDFEGLTDVKAHEYVDNIEAIAKAVESGDEEELGRQIELLNRRPFL